MDCARDSLHPRKEKQRTWLHWGFRDTTLRSQIWSRRKIRLMANKAKWHTCECSMFIRGYFCVCTCVYVGATRHVTSPRTVYVNETVARWMSYRYYFYRSAGNFAAHHATALYWRKVLENEEKYTPKRLPSRKHWISAVNGQKNSDPKKYSNIIYITFKKNILNNQSNHTTHFVNTCHHEHTLCISNVKKKLYNNL